MQTSDASTASNNELPNPGISKIDWGFWIWVGCSLVLIFGIVLAGTAWAVQHAMLSGRTLSDSQKRTVLALATLPKTVKNAARELLWQFSDEPTPQLHKLTPLQNTNWSRHFPEPADNGYLLYSGIDRNSKQSIVELIRVSDGQSIAQWIPDWDYINDNNNDKLTNFSFRRSKKTLAPVSPLLMSNGDIVFHAGGSLIRMDICTGKPIWKIGKSFHHSTELDSNGNIVVPAKSDLDFPVKVWSSTKLEDDSIAMVSPNGTLIQNSSLVKILIDNNLAALVFGIGGVENSGGDIVHINQITPALDDSEYWRKGDLLISSRNLSTVFLYRPSTGKIIWHQTGPWMNQHSAEFVDDHRISIFNNNVTGRQQYDFMSQTDHNTVVVYDFRSGKTSEPFKNFLDETKPRTRTQGRARILPDGGLFVEESNYGRHLRFSVDGLMWSRVNEYDDKHVAVLSWSRYLTKSEAEGPVKAIKLKVCDGRRKLP